MKSVGLSLFNYKYLYLALYVTDCKIAQCIEVRNRDTVSNWSGDGQRGERERERERERQRERERERERARNDVVHH